MARPNDSITRQEAMVLSGRVLKLLGVAKVGSDNASVLNQFGDKDNVADWAINEVVLCVGNGIINGSDGNLELENNIIRAEAATVAVRLEDFIIKNS